MNILLALHNLNRWVVVVLIVVALYRAYTGWLQKKPWVNLDRQVSLFTTIGLDVQFLLGMLLFLGRWLPFWSDIGTLMSNPIYRLFALEHPFYGVAALIVAHVGTSRAKKAAHDEGKHKAIAIFFSIVVILLIILIPWSRPLLRGI